MLRKKLPTVLPYPPSNLSLMFFMHEMKRNTFIFTATYFEFYEYLKAGMANEQ